MTINLFDLELNNIENNGLNKPLDGSGSKREANHRKLAARRAVEDHREQQRLRQELSEDYLEVF